MNKFLLNRIKLNNNNLLTSAVRAVRENNKPRPCFYMAVRFLLDGIVHFGGENKKNTVARGQSTNFQISTGGDQKK